jgi:hypothetical protein
MKKRKKVPRFEILCLQSEELPKRKFYFLWIKIMPDNGPNLGLIKYSN